MRVGFLGMTHLGQTLAQASRIRGIEVAEHPEDGEIIFVTQDVENHVKLGVVDALMKYAAQLPTLAPIVLVSQVPPGYTRKWAKYIQTWRLYYQVDTIIMSCALRRAVFPERIVVGGYGPKEDGINGVYESFLDQFECPVVRMTYESAEMVKLAVNYYLTAQILATNELAKAAEMVGADWTSVAEGVSGDKRIGAYLEPGQPNQHLLRDTNTINGILWNSAQKSAAQS